VIWRDAGRDCRLVQYPGSTEVAAYIERGAQWIKRQEAAERVHFLDETNKQIIEAFEH
jgi:hypothetical protein